MALETAARLLKDVSVNTNSDPIQVGAGVYNINIWAANFGGGEIEFYTNVVDPATAYAWIPVTTLDGTPYIFPGARTFDWDVVSPGAWIQVRLTGASGASNVNVQIARVLP